MDRILEIGGVAAGFCGRLFAQSGYDVVRVETGTDDPAWVPSRAMSLFLHPGKRRVRTDDPELIAELAANADVVVAQAKDADGIDALGFDDWAAPVKCAVTPFGRTGPKRNWQATPNVLLAMGGYTNLMGDPGRAPLSLPGHYVEFQSGALAFTAANACRMAGEPNVVDIGMLEVVMSLSQFTTVMWHCSRVIRSRHGSDFHSVVPSNLFRCADGWIYMNIVPSFWDPFTVFLERPELAIDERFVTNEKRMRNRDALHDLIADILAPLPRAEIEQRIDECRIPVGVVQTFDEVLADPHLAVRDMWQTIAAPDGRSLRSPRPSWRIHGENRAAPELAESVAGEGRQHMESRGNG
ncbi:MAG: CoA transferase [Gammaproteobacteria bacterium]|nr:CoA transferase [Gammaproteobacteria bacterium]